LRIERNELTTPVRSSAMNDFNTPPTDALVYTRKQFCNLILPDHYKLHCLGWITRDRYLQEFLKYPAWFCPKDSINRYENTPWSQISERDERLLVKLGIENRVSKTPTRVAAGLMKSTGQQGACCYVFPNIFRSGLKETNLYVLPKDLSTMDSLK